MIFTQERIMELNEKLQELRKNKGLTQEELAQCLFVSRAAVSKWESGRGYPNIDSLKAIAEFYGITVDSLLSGDELLCIVREESREKEKRSRDTVYGLLDIGAVLLWLLPFFRQGAEGAVQAVSLSVMNTAGYLKVTYFAAVIALALWGVLTLAVGNFHFKGKKNISLILSALAAVLFIVGLQPYAAVFVLAFLAIKVIILIKR